MLEFDRLAELRVRRPLIHCVSNIVSAADCANLALAVGASPIMAQAPEEMAEITAASQATVLNIGTPDAVRFQVCARCGKETAARHQPLVLDPVGVGASSWRLAQVQALLEQFTPSILRVNLGEAQALLAAESRERGVDSPSAARQERIETAGALARKRQTVVLLSGPEDVITDGTAGWLVSGGSGEMTRVTGTGCMLSVLCGAFAAVEPNALQAAALASAFWKVCSQQAESSAAGRGLGSFHAALMDAAGAMTAARFASEAQCESL